MNDTIFLSLIALRGLGILVLMILAAALWRKIDRDSEAAWWAGQRKQVDNHGSGV